MCSFNNSFALKEFWLQECWEWFPKEDSHKEKHASLIVYTESVQFLWIPPIIALSLLADGIGMAFVELCFSLEDRIGRDFFQCSLFLSSM